MNPFIFRTPTRIIYGPHAASGVNDLVKEYGARKPFLLTDKNIMKAGIVAPIITSLNEFWAGQTLVFEDIPPDSDIVCVNEAAKIAKAANCDCLVAVGGGSVIDTAKVANICLTYGGHMLEYQGLNNLPSKLLPLICLPTTAGTGSEVSMVAVINDAGSGQKLFFGSEFLAPNATILDPLLIVSLPVKLTAATGFDALTHGLEAMAATNTSSPITDALCLESIRLIFKYLLQAVRDGNNLEARSNTLIASTMAGMVVTNAGVGIIHALAHATGSKFHTHHGMTNAVFLPKGLSFNLPEAKARYALIARFLGISEAKDDLKAAQELILAVNQLLKDCQLPTCLKELGIPQLSDQTLDELAETTLTDPAIIFNPKSASKEDIINIIKRTY